MKINSIDSILNNMNTISNKIKNNIKNKQNFYINTQNNNLNFFQELTKKIININNIQIQAKNKIEKFELGDKNVALSDAILEMHKAFISLNIAVQINNRMISAYQEIMNMNL